MPESKHHWLYRPTWLGGRSEGSSVSGGTHAPMPGDHGDRVLDHEYIRSLFCDAPDEALVIVKHVIDQIRAFRFGWISHYRD